MKEMKGFNLKNRAHVVREQYYTKERAKKKRLRKKVLSKQMLSKIKKQCLKRAARGCVNCEIPANNLLWWDVFPGWLERPLAAYVEEHLGIKAGFGTLGPCYPDRILFLHFK